MIARGRTDGSVSARVFAPSPISLLDWAILNGRIRQVQMNNIFK